MTATPVPTVPTGHHWSGHQIHQQNQRCPDRPDCPDLKMQGGSKKEKVEALLAWMECQVEAAPAAHRGPDKTPLEDRAEAQAMAAYYAMPVRDVPPCTMKEGLLRGFYAHHHLSLPGRHR